MSKLDQIRSMRERNFEERKQRVDNNSAGLVRVAPVINKMPRHLQFGKAASNAERQAKWRAANRDLHRQRSRESMRKLRSKAEAN